MKKKINRKEQSIEMINKLVMINIFLQRIGNRQITKFGLNQPQFAVLGEIARNKDLLQKNILGELLLEKSNLSKIIKKLYTMSLITMNPSETDGRKTVLNVTDKGRELLNECMNELDNMKLAFTEPLKDEELDQLTPAISRLTELVVHHIKTENNNKG